MPAYALHLLLALLIAGLTRLVGYPLQLGGGRSVDALDTLLLMLALVNLRLGWQGANVAGGGRTSAWFVVLGPRAGRRSSPIRWFRR